MNTFVFFSLVGTILRAQTQNLCTQLCFPLLLNVNMNIPTSVLVYNRNQIKRFLELFLIE